jgi:hypothetical protein
MESLQCFHTNILLFIQKIYRFQCGTSRDTPSMDSAVRNEKPRSRRTLALSSLSQLYFPAREEPHLQLIVMKIFESHAGGSEQSFC